MAEKEKEQILWEEELMLRLQDYKHKNKKAKELSNQIQKRGSVPRRRPSAWRPTAWPC